MEVDSENLASYGMEYLNLKIKFKKSSNPDEGVPGFLISINWLQKF